MAKRSLVVSIVTILWIACIEAPRLATASPPGFSIENHSATDGAGAEFNGAALPLTVGGSNTLLIAAWHSEYDGDFPNAWRVECSGVAGTLIAETNGYTGGNGNRRFRIYYWLNLSPGAKTILVTNDLSTNPNELAVSVVLLTNVAQINSLGTTILDVSTNNRTGESETVATTTNDLVVHVIADRLFIKGILGNGETSRSVANDGSVGGNASLWISTKPGEPFITTVSSTGWASSIINGVAIVVRGRGPTPTISEIPNQFTLLNTPTAAIPFTIDDEDTPVGNLSLSKNSSNPALVPINNIVFGGSGANRTVTVTPVAGQSGVATITVIVSDGTNSANENFAFTVDAQSMLTKSFTNTATITIPSLGNAAPYLSTINAAGMGGIISNVTVTLRNMSHTYPADIDVLLVGPGGQKAMVFSDVGGSGDVNNVMVTLSSGAATALTATGQIISGNYKPTDVEPGQTGNLDTFSAPAPGGPYTSALSVFNRQSANGVWSLFVVDDGPGDQGSIAGGWSLTITTVSSGFPGLPEIAPLTLTAEGVQVIVGGEIGIKYALQASSDLINWIQVGVQTNTTGSIVFNEQPTTNSVHFYRAVSVP